MLPFSSVSVERVFSVFRDIKTHKRNRLTVENLEVCILNYQSFNRKEVPILPAMVDNYRNLDFSDDLEEAQKADKNTIKESKMTINQ
jgi:hypothetical protein